MPSYYITPYSAAISVSAILFQSSSLLVVIILFIEANLSMSWFAAQEKCSVEIKQVEMMQLLSQVSKFHWICLLLAILLSYKIRLVKNFKHQVDKDGPYPKVLELPNITLSSGKYQILDKIVQVTSKVSSHRHQDVQYFFAVLTAPKNFEKRAMTREILRKQASNTSQWVFVLGQTNSSTTQVY